MNAVHEIEPTQEPTARNGMARAAGPGERFPGIMQGLKGRPAECPAPVPPRQGGEEFVWTSSRPFRPGCHRPGFQPNADAYTKHPALLRQLEIEALAALAKNANARRSRRSDETKTEIYIGFDKHLSAEVVKVTE